jgi:hypothetical protein
MRKSLAPDSVPFREREFDVVDLGSCIDRCDCRFVIENGASSARLGTGLRS